MSIVKVQRLALCGGVGAGKTSIGQRLSEQEPDELYNSTIGVDYFALRLPEYQTRINIWDLAGQLRFQTITLPYVRESDILIYVYDLSSHSSLRDIKNLHETYERLGIKARIIIVGTKRSKETQYNSCRTDGEQFAKKLDVPHWVLDSKANLGFDTLRESIIQELELKKCSLEHYDENLSSSRTCYLKCNII